MLLPLVTPQMLHVDYWLDRTQEPDAVLWPEARTAAILEESRSISDIPDLLRLPDALPRADILVKISTKPPQKAQYQVDGSPIEEAFWAQVRANIAIETLPESVPVRYAMAVRRTAVRSMPTSLLALKEPGNLPFDRLQETTIDLGWSLAVLHTSQDGKWAFALTSHYAGWVRTADIATTNREALQAWAAQPFAVATDPWCSVGFPGEVPQAVVQMGTRLPLLPSDGPLQPAEVPFEVDGQCQLRTGYLATCDSWHEGHLQLTTRSLLTQAFKLLGERYAWGGMRMDRAGRDCSRLLRDSYATMGVYLPRNSGEQGMVGKRAVTFEPGESNESRIAKLETIPVGALLLLPGHVMLHLGVVDGVPYAIHDLWGYAHPEGSKDVIGRVAVTALPPQPSVKPPHTLLELLTHVQVLG